MDPQRTDSGDTMTTDQMARLLRADLDNLETVAAVHARESDRWDGNARRTDLGGPNGEGRDAIIAAMHASHRPELEAAATAAATAARAADGNARRILAQIGDDRMSLPPTARSAAAELEPMIERDAARLSLPRLAVELRHAVATGDTPSMWCWARALAPRLAARPEGVEHPDQAKARAELTRLVSQVKGALRDTTHDGIRAEVDRVLERASATRAAADRGKRALAGPAKTADGQTKVPWPS